MKKIIIYLLIIGVATIVMGLNSFIIYEKLKAKNEDYIELTQSYRESLARENSLYIESQDKSKEIQKVHDALETALKDNQVIQTLLNKDMKDWTPEGILRMRAKLASLPYGSPFPCGFIVTAPFGSRELTGTYWKGAHPGVDLYPKSGNDHERILSPVDGKVVTWGRNDRVYGNYLIIETLDGEYQLKFAHLSRIGIVSGNKVSLKEGMIFKAGQQIARMGDTGMATGPHLHLEYHIKEKDGWRLLNASAILSYIGKPTKKAEKIVEEY